MSIKNNEKRIVLKKIFLLVGISIFSNCVFGQQDLKKEKDSFPVIKIVGSTKIFSADKSFNDQLKNSVFFLKNNDVTHKTSQNKVDPLIGASLENKSKSVIKRK